MRGWRLPTERERRTLGERRTSERRGWRAAGRVEYECALASRQSPPASAAYPLLRRAQPPSQPRTPHGSPAA
eukprot:1439584-Rhodomonas_salina.1